MNQSGNIDTMEFGYEETAYESQAPFQHEQHVVNLESEKALSIASALQLLRSQRLNDEGEADV